MYSMVLALLRIRRLGATVPIAPFSASHNYRIKTLQDWMDWASFSYPVNLTQQPPASLPCGLDS